MRVSGFYTAEGNRKSIEIRQAAACAPGCYRKKQVWKSALFNSQHSPYFEFWVLLLFLCLFFFFYFHPAWILLLKVESTWVDTWKFYIQRLLYQEHWWCCLTGYLLQPTESHDVIHQQVTHSKWLWRETAWEISFCLFIFFVLFWSFHFSLLTTDPSPINAFLDD